MQGGRFTPAGEVCGRGTLRFCISAAPQGPVISQGRAAGEIARPTNHWERPAETGKQYKPHRPCVGGRCSHRPGNLAAARTLRADEIIGPYEGAAACRPRSRHPFAPHCRAGVHARRAGFCGGNTVELCKCRSPKPCYTAKARRRAKSPALQTIGNALPRPISDTSRTGLA